MIEVKTYPDNMVIYINFECKGFPENLPITDIQIREKPSKLLETNPEIEEGELVENQEEGQPENIFFPELEGEQQELKTQPIVVPVESVKNQIREIILKGNQIKFSNEYIGPIVQQVNVESSAQ